MNQQHSPTQRKTSARYSSATLIATGILSAAVTAVAVHRAPPEQSTPAQSAAILSASTHVLAGPNRGVQQDPVIVADPGAAVSLLVPLGRCRDISSLDLAGPGIANRGGGDRAGGIMPISREVGEGITITIPQALPGVYRLAIRYDDIGCSSEYRHFTVENGDPSEPGPDDSARTALLEGRWVARDSSTTRLMPAGGSLEILIEDLAEDQPAFFVARDMGAAGLLWDSVTNARYVDIGGGMIQGSIRGLDGLDHPFTIVREGTTLKGAIADGALAKSAGVQRMEDGDDGGWTSDPD